MTEDSVQPESEQETSDISDEAAEAMRLAATPESSRPAEAEVEHDAIFDARMVLRLMVQGSDIPILLSPSDKECVLGRRDPVVGDTPDVDLGPYAAYQMGLSRRHAAFRVIEKRLYVWDLGSKNGSYLNGYKLQSMQPHMLRSGDELRMGKMVVKLYFE